jgi:hypothetical protein
MYLDSKGNLWASVQRDVNHAQSGHHLRQDPFDLTAYVEQIARRALAEASRVPAEPTETPKKKRRLVALKALVQEAVDGMPAHYAFSSEPLESTYLKQQWELLVIRAQAELDELLK